ncbi:MAG: hypothetical protein ACJASX_000565 [Limisphaerales bacterium]|jgi:hypothetical protein
MEHDTQLNGSVLFALSFAVDIGPELTDGITVNLFPADPSRYWHPSPRDMLRVPGLGTAGLSLPQILPAESMKQRFTSSAKNCIYIFLCGGPSQLDMWDMKPDAPSEIRGPFNPISTNVPGMGEPCLTVVQ